MNQRVLGRTGITVSEVGLGCEHLQGMPYEQVKAVVDAALENGMNIFDCFMSEPEVRTNIGRALAGRRGQVCLQGHIGATWIDGQYERSTDAAVCKLFFEDFLTRYQTDYVDIGMIHFVDTDEDYHAIFDSDVIQYVCSLKEKGIIRALGMSSHNPVVAKKAVETGLLDVLMFSLNPAYDLLPEDVKIDDLFAPVTYQQEGLNGVNPSRAALYHACELHGTAITVMKSFGAGALLKAESSPFGMALTPGQCIHYALTRPAVASVLVGCKTPDEVRAAVGYSDLSDAERDYSAVLSATPKYALKGRCMYCNHCLPCPSRIDIAKVNQYLDLALQQKAVPDTVRAHYEALSAKASDCIQCGSCESNCPFDVRIIKRMERTVELFGK